MRFPPRIAALRVIENLRSRCCWPVPTVSGTVDHMKAEAVSPGAEPVRDRRDSRWDEHRRARRRALVDAALAAVSRHGAGVGMDEIAVAAGTSKAAVYRHFADRGELHTA